jgi:hypothetical protein
MSPSLRRAEPQQGRRNYVADGVLFTQIGAENDVTNRPDSIWLLVDVETAGPGRTAAIVGAFANPEIRLLARMAISGKDGDVADAERELRTIAGGLELIPAEIRTESAAKKVNLGGKLAWPFSIVTAAALAFATWLALNSKSPDIASIARNTPGPFDQKNFDILQKLDRQGVSLNEASWAKIKAEQLKPKMVRDRLIAAFKSLKEQNEVSLLLNATDEQLGKLADAVIGKLDSDAPIPIPKASQ